MNILLPVAVVYLIVVLIAKALIPKDHGPVTHALNTFSREASNVCLLLAVIIIAILLLNGAS